MEHLSNTEQLAALIRASLTQVKDPKAIEQQPEAVLMGCVNGLLTVMNMHMASTIVWLMVGVKYPELAKDLLEPVDIDLNIKVREIADAINIVAGELCQPK